MAFQYATRKQQDKQRDKIAKIAQGWMQKGFTPKQVAEGITNRTGHQTDVKDGVVRMWGCYNSEYKDQGSFYVIREITAEQITTPKR